MALSAEDDNNVTLNWSWGGGVATDSDFLLTSDGNLTFRELPDYEAAKFNIHIIRLFRYQMVLIRSIETLQSM